MSVKKKFDQSVVLVAKTVLVNKGKALLIRRGSTAPSRPGGWDLPGGNVEPDEDPYVTAQRETKEETGLEIDRPKIANLELLPSNQFRGNTLIMIFRTTVSAADVKLSYEHDDYRWVTREQLENYDLPNIYLNTLQEALEQISSFD